MTYYIACETLPTVMWQPGCARSLGENGHMSMYGWVPTLSTWDYCNIVNQLYPNTKEKVQKVKSKQKPNNQDLLWASGKGILVSLIPQLSSFH